MPKYKNVETGKTVEFSEAHYDQIKSQGNYVPVAKPKAKKAKPTTD